MSSLLIIFETTQKQLQLHLVMPKGECRIPENVCWRILLLKLRIEPVRSLRKMTSAWRSNKTCGKVSDGPLLKNNRIGEVLFLQWIRLGIFGKSGQLYHPLRNYLMKLFNANKLFITA